MNFRLNESTEAAIGRFAIRVSLIETLMDDFIFQAGREMQEPKRAVFLKKFKELPRSFAEKAKAASFIVDEYIEKKPNLSFSPKLAKQGVEHFLSELSEVRNTIFHSQLCQVVSQEDGFELYYIRYERRKDKGKGTYEFAPREVTSSQLDHLIDLSDEAIPYFETAKLSLCWMLGTWSEHAISRPDHALRRDLRIDEAKQKHINFHKLGSG